MSDIEQEIDVAIAHLKFDNDVVKLSRVKAQAVVDTATRAFVVGNPRVWWLSLQRPYTVTEYPESNGYLHLKDYIPSGNEFCWFIPEPDEGNDVRHPVYRASIDKVSSVLSECNFFEYYLVGLDYTWLVLENDHNQIIACTASDYM